MSEPIRLHPDNDRRFLWRGKAQFLLGSTEHYGALLNASFDYQRYLDTIAATGLNTTRIFACYRELEVSIVELGYANPVAPRPEDYLAPWARAGAEHGLGPDGRPKFDLDTWDERYFARLRALLSAAGARGVVVELVFFSSQYNEATWMHSPLHPASNVNGVGSSVRTWRDFLTLADDTVAEHQRRVVRKLVRETNDFDNLYYEICNEPGYSDEYGPRPDLVRAWQRALVRTVREVESALPKRHLVAVNGHQTLPVRDPDAPGETSIAVLDDGYYHRDPEIDFINVHYISHRAPREGLSHDYAGGARPRHQRSYRFGQLTTFTTLRAGGKPIGFNEDYAGFVSNQPPKPMQARMEAWESLLAGCVAYDHLDFTFTPDDPTGSAAGATPSGLAREWFDGRPLRRQLGHLLAVAGEMDLATLRPDPLAVAYAPRGTGAVAARTRGARRESLFVYLADLRPIDAGYGVDTVGGSLVLSVPPVPADRTSPARYTVRLLDPKTGAWKDTAPTEADEAGILTVRVPPFREDTLLCLDAVGAEHPVFDHAPRS